MSRKEHEKFWVVLNILVFISFLFVFIFVHLERIKHQDLITTLLAAMVLSSIFLLLGVMTLIPSYAIYVGKTLIIFSILMAIGEMYSSRTNFSIFSIAEILLAFVMFLYGLELKSKDKKLISLKALINI